MSKQPEVHWTKPWDRNDDNDLEELFTEFCSLANEAWDREPRFFYEYDPDLPDGYTPRGYCPDFYLPGYDVYVEIYEGEKSDANRYELTNKRKRIRWLSAYTEHTVVLIHLSNWPADSEDLGRLISRAQKEARDHREMVRDTGVTCSLPARRKRPKHRRKKPPTEVA